MKQFWVLEITILRYILPHSACCCGSTRCPGEPVWARIFSLCLARSQQDAGSGTDRSMLSLEMCVKACSQHMNWSATSRPSYTARSLATRVSVTIWLAVATPGRLVLSQFVRCEHSHWNTRVQSWISVQLSSVEFTSVLCCERTLIKNVYVADTGRERLANWRHFKYNSCQIFVDKKIKMLTVKQVASIFISPYIAAQRNIQYYNNYIKT